MTFFHYLRNINFSQFRKIHEKIFFEAFGQNLFFFPLKVDFLKNATTATLLFVPTLQLWAQLKQ